MLSKKEIKANKIVAAIWDTALDDQVCEACTSLHNRIFPIYSRNSRNLIHLFINDRLLLTGHSCYFACFNLVTNKVQVDNQPLALANAPSSFWLDLHCLLSVQESAREVRAS